MLHEKLDRIKSTLRKMIIMCKDRISILSQDFNASYSLWDEYAIEDFEEQLEHFKLLKQEAKESYNLVNELQS